MECPLCRCFVSLDILDALWNELRNLTYHLTLPLDICRNPTLPLKVAFQRKGHRALEFLTDTMRVQDLPPDPNHPGRVFITTDLEITLTDPNTLFLAWIQNADTGERLSAIQALKTTSIDAPEEDEEEMEQHEKPQVEPRPILEMSSDDEEEEPTPPASPPQQQQQEEEQQQQQQQEEEVQQQQEEQQQHRSGRDIIAAAANIRRRRRERTRDPIVLAQRRQQRLFATFRRRQSQVDVLSRRIQRHAEALVKALNDLVTTTRSLHETVIKLLQDRDNIRNNTT